MKTSVISFYHQFKCLGGKCPHSCCKGWQIPVDEATYNEYRKIGGAYGRALLFRVWRSNPRVFIKNFDRCPFWNSDKLCQFQVNGEMRLMPLVCRVFPRDGVLMNDEIEVTMQLSCISAARVFLQNPGRLSFEPTDEVIEPTWGQDNDDPDFLAFLKEDREQILDFVWEEGTDLSERWAALYAYVYREHDAILANRLHEAKGMVLSADPDSFDIYGLNREPTFAFFSVQTIDRMILEHINYGALWLREPKFYKLIRYYRRMFADMYLDEADRELDRAVREMMAAGYADKYRSYFSYCIQELYIKAYETYFVLRQFLFAVLYTELLMMFDLVDYRMNGGRIADLERQAEILMLCEQGIRHNPSLTKNLFKVIREEFL